MKAFDYAELFLNTAGKRGANELRQYVASGGDINEQDADGTSAMYVATHPQDRAGRVVAPQLVALVAELGGA